MPFLVYSISCIGYNLKYRKRGKKMKNTKKLVIAALFTALSCIGTMIHIPAVLGYIHLGDALVLLSGILLGPIYGGLAAGLGSALADLINGYAIFVPGTFVIKALCAIICGFIFHRFKPTDGAKTRLYLILVIAGVLGELNMLLGYFLYEILITMITSGSTTSFSACVTTAALGIPYNMVQALAAIILSVILVPILTKIEDLKAVILS